MSEGGDDDAQKTEEPTQHKLDEAQKKGQVVSSREINHFFVILSLAIVLGWLLPDVLVDTQRVLERFIVSPEDIPFDESSLKDVFVETSIAILGIIAGPVAIIMVLALAGGGLQNKFLFATERIKPKFEKINPFKGAKKLFSMKSIVEFIKGLIKITLVGAVAVMAIWPEMGRLETLPTYEIEQVMLLMQGLASDILIGVCSVLFLIAIFDYVYQRFDFMKSMRMSKQEIRDEYKQQEGDPHIKSKLKQIRAEKAKQRMMANVPKADVIITNPTHYAVALTYETGLMQAPILIAKGVDNVAFRIRDVAKENDIPIVENPPLARALHASVELDQEIPYEHYKAVAEVIGYVYRLKGKM